MVKKSRYLQTQLLEVNNLIDTQEELCKNDDSDFAFKSSLHSLISQKESLEESIKGKVLCKSSRTYKKRHI